MEEGFWISLVFGWPGPIAAGALSIAAVVFRRPGWFVIAAILLAPFSVWMSGYPAVPWAILLPGLPLLAATAMRRGKEPFAWVSTAILIAVLMWFGLPIIRRHLPDETHESMSSSALFAGRSGGSVALRSG